MTAEANLSITSIAGLTNNPNQTITGTGAAGATVKVLDGTTLLGTTVVGSDGTWSEVVALSGDGAHSISAMSEGTAIAPTVTTLVIFDGQNGHGMSLITDSAGKIYGTTTGSVFEITGSNHQTFSTLATFNNYSSYDGRLFGDLALDASGDLYGTIKGGGRFGSVFELSGDNHEIQNTVFYFNGDNGSAPLAGVFADQSGNIFGTTANGGINSDGVDPNSGFGTVFQVSESSFTNLVSFNNGVNGSANNGVQPFNLVFDTDGTIYGTTAFGGQYGNGTLFELTGTNHETLTTLFNFNGSNGSFPAGSLVLDPSGNIYGTTASGGRSGYGTAFKLSGPNHDILTTLVDFDTTTGQRPFGLVSDSAGNLYGATTYLGGTNGAGIVFELSGSNHQTLTTLFNFSSNGSSGPYNSSGPYDLAIDGADNLFVIMAGGGTYGAGGVLHLSGLNQGKETASSQSVTFSLDTIAPTITLLSQSSNNALATVAKAGDVITQLFTSTDTVTSVLINGQAASVVRESGNNYSATYTVQADSANGSADVVITAQDLAGNITSNTVADAMSWETLFSLNDSGADGTSTFGAYTSTSGISGSPVVSTTVKYDSSSRSSVYFNGTSQLDVINDPALNIGTQNIKISFEMKTDGYQNPYSVMINGLNGTNGTDTSIGNDPAYGNVIHYWPGAGLPKIDGTTNINDANWHQVVATQVDGVASLFVDGTLENQQYVGVLNHDITQLRVGHLLGQWAGNWDNSFKGWIDNLTISSGSATSAQSVTIDTVDPIVSVLGQTSSNALTTVARAGDVITQSFTSTDTVASVLINGQAASVVHGVGNNYTATYTVQTGSTNGLATANISAFDLAGNLASVSLTGGVAIDTVDPVITLLGQTSNNALATVAKAGDIITQSFTSTDAVTSVLINGQEASVVRGSGDSYTATYMVEMGSTNGVVNTVVSAQDAAGNTTAQSVAGSVTIDTVAPTFTHISALSNNSRNTFAKVGDVITETFTSTDIVTSVTINGQTASVIQGLGGNYTATYTVQTASLNGQAEVVIATQDLAGNVASSVFAGDTGWNAVFSLNPSGSDGSSNFGAYTSVSGISGSPIVSTTVKYDANSTSSVYFNGTSQINVINDPALQIGSQNIKISFEMKADGYQTPYSTIIYSLGDVRGADTVIGNDPAYGNFVNFQPGNVSQYGPSWGFPNIAGTTNINDGSWHQVTTTQIDGVASIYVDGALENQQIVGLLNHDITNLAIGHLLGQYAGNWDNSFKGWIDDLTISSQSSTNNTGVTIDTIDPVITVLGQTSTNALTTVAKAGDVITQSFTSTDTVASVLIDGQAASVVHGLGNNYTATYTVQMDSTNGLAAANISAFDLAGNVASVSATGSVAIDTLAPIVAHISERTNAQSSMDFSIKSDDTYWSYWCGLQNNYTTQWHAPSILLGEGITDTSLLSFEATGLRYGFNNSLTDRMGDQSNAAGVIFPQSGSPGLATVVTLNLPNGVALTDTAPLGALLIGNPELGWKAVFSPTVGNGLNGALQTQVNRAPVSLAEMFGQSVAVGTKLFLTYNDQDTGNPGTYELSITSPDLGGLVSSTTLAKAGDVITETFTATDTVTSVLINGQLASVAHRSGENYIASYTVQTSDSNGAADIVITARDAAGNVTTQNIAGSVTVDTVAPIVTHISELSNNAKNTLAKAGDIITESFISADAVTGVSINGQAATVVHGLGNNYTATYTVQSNAMNGLADVIITAQDLVGNTSSTTVVGLVTVDTVAPIVAILSTGGVTKIST